jgi:hypothetical protein
MMNEEKKPEQDDEISLIELFQKIRGLATFLISKWVIILLAGVFGGAIGFGYAYIQPIKYISKISFVVEESKGGGGGLASLAGQFGFDMGGVGGGGIFSGDNVLLFLKSESLCRETLFTAYDEKGTTLADRYAQIMKMKEGWEKNPQIGKVDFNALKDSRLPRKEDSLMQAMVAGIIKSELLVAKPDKKASFIEVKTTMQDELLSKLFSERLVQLATDRYVESKTKTKSLNVAKLQRKSDSLAALLNDKTYSAAASQQNLVDVNPAIRKATINAEISSREKAMVLTIFSEVVKNLEISKTMLNQETPIIQVVDQSSFPLEKERVGKLRSLILGSFLAGFVVVLFLLLKRWFSSLQASLK